MILATAFREAAGSALRKISRALPRQSCPANSSTLTISSRCGTLTTQDDGAGYGLGWSIASLDDHRVVGHNGGQASTSTCLKLLPDRQLAAAIMTNLEGAALDDLANALLKLYLRASTVTHTSLIARVFRCQYLASRRSLYLPQALQCRETGEQQQV